jgi:hypothetical protein
MKKSVKKVLYYHWRNTFAFPFLQKGEEDLISRNERRFLHDFSPKAVTFAATIENGTLTLAIAVCSGTENFSKKEGRKLATRRLTINPVFKSKAGGWLRQEPVEEGATLSTKGKDIIALCKDRIPEIVKHYFISKVNVLVGEQPLPEEVDLFVDYTVNNKLATDFFMLDVEESTSPLS